MTNTSFAAQVKALEQEKAKALAKKISEGIVRIQEKKLLDLLARRDAKIAKAQQAVDRAQAKLDKLLTPRYKSQKVD